MSEKSKASLQPQVSSDSLREVAPTPVNTPVTSPVFARMSVVNDGTFLQR